MKLNLNKISVLLLVLVAQLTFAQERAVSGIVSDNSGVPIPGVSVLVKGSKSGTQTNFDGTYSINASPNSILVFSYIGLATKEVPASSKTVNVKLSDRATELEGVVVTALGIKRDKKSLGYATQEVKGDDLNKVNTGNVANSISGKVAGIEIKRSGNMGGSTNVVIRGTKSITGNNQALWVVDGIPLNNANTNSGNQKSGRSGYDYGNAASDINPDDIETINVLKGAAASALYGSRASSGVIIVTTKKGKTSNGIGVTINSGITQGYVDSKTLPEYQTQYGGGDNSNFRGNINLGGGSYPRAATYPDSSWGAPFDSNKLAYQWYSFYPELTSYGKATPWIAGKNTPNDFYKPSTTYTNSVALAGGNDKGTFRFGYTRFDQEGILPNSKLKKDNFNFSSSYNLSSKTTVSATANYIKSDALGQNETGYGDGGNNMLSSFRQWWQTSTDIKDLENAYNATGKNITWNVASPSNLAIAFHDNPYFLRENNYNTFNRDRFFGNFTVNTEINNWFEITGKGAMDSYHQIQEERVAVGSKRQSELAGSYTRYDKTFREVNLDLILNFKADITPDLNFRAFIGGNTRRSIERSIFGTTNGGLVVPEIYTLSNSKVTPSSPSEAERTIGVNSGYTNVSFGYLDTFFLEGTYRIDQSSTLPKANNTYTYPSITGTYIFSKHINADWLSFGKLRLNYAETGNDAAFAVIQSVYSKNANFGDSPMFTAEFSKRNPDLKSERTKGSEIGLEMQFFKKRVGFDISYYKSNTTDQIIDIIPSLVTGYGGLTVNSGELENKGFEVSLNVMPIKTTNFSWETRINWAKNKNLVKSLANGMPVTIGTFNENTSVVAEVGQPYGLIKGSGYLYKNGQRVVEANGDYAKQDNVTIGNINADWTGGINNIFRYKNLSFSFLIDVKQGGSVFSLDQAYGQASGLYQNTVGTNHLGNPIRNTIANGGGQILPGVQADGTPNTVVAAVSNADGTSHLGNNSFPMESFVYDASYIKLREVSLSYRLPSSFLKGTSLNDMTFTLNGNNLWIIDKDLPYADPESGFSSGNFQGVQSGVLPTTREISFNVKLQF